MAGTLLVLPKLCQQLVGGQVLSGLGRARQWQVNAQALALAGQRGKRLGRQVGRQRAGQGRSAGRAGQQASPKAAAPCAAALTAAWDGAHHATAGKAPGTVKQIIPDVKRLMLFDLDNEEAAFHPPAENPV